MKRISLALLLLALVVLSGCAGGKILLTAKNLKSPVSASPVFYSDNGVIIDNEGYSVIGKFEKSYVRWSIFWTIIPFSPYESDMSEDLTTAIKTNKGDAIVNLKVKVSPNAYNGFVTYTFLNHLPVIPTFHRVSVTGDIVKANSN